MVLFLTVHHWESARRAGVHHLASSLRDSGWRVLFATVGLSPISWVRRDERRALVPRNHWNRPVPAELGIASFAWVTPWHPVNLRLEVLNRFSRPMVAAYGRLPLGSLESAIRGSRLVVIESGPALLLADRIKRIAPLTPLVYRQSDWPGAVGFHPAIALRENQAQDLFDLVSVPDESRRRFFAPTTNLVVQPHGVQKSLFDQDSDSPYRELSFTRNAVFTGMEGLDLHFLETASTIRPDWGFHVLGPWSERLLKRPNVIFHGLTPFRDTIPFVRHADLGLNCVEVDRGELRRETLKTIQYTYCRLPIIAEERVAAPWPHICTYRHGSVSSIEHALLAAESFPREAVPASAIRSWPELADELVQLAGAQGPTRSGDQA